MSAVKALCIAGGFGTRLESAGMEIPKGLIENGETTILGRMLEDLSKVNDIKDKAMITNAKFYDTYKNWLTDKAYMPGMTLINNSANTSEERLGAIGDIIYALDYLHWWDTNIIVLPSDTLYKFQLKEFLEFAKSRKGLSTVVNDLGKETIAGRLGCAGVENDRILDFEEKPTKPKHDYAIVPFYYYSTDTLKYIKSYRDDGGNLDAPSSIIGWFLDKKYPVYAFKTNNKTLDVGTLNDIPNAKNFV